MQNAKFSLPRDVTSEQTTLKNGNMAFIIRHNTLGELGKIIIIPRASGKTQIDFEIAGQRGDPLAPQRMEIFGPIMEAVSSAMDKRFGPDEEYPVLSTPQSETHLIESQVMPCETCGAITSLIIYVENAQNEGYLEDHFRMMFDKIKELDVPTWIVGAEEEKFANNQFFGEALVLKVWPERHEAIKLNSIDFNKQIDHYMDTHCKEAN